jgi:anti-sigma regulatory factor (Ser/Thr protein kinase)
MIPATPEGNGFRVNLAALPSGPRLARRFLTLLLEQWGIEGDAADHALLLVSELVTNAALATGRVDGPDEPGPDETVCTIIVRVSVTDLGLRVEVWDNCPDTPVIADFDELSESGRGLFLVATLAEEWGCFPEVVAPGCTAGKTVWFRLKASAPPVLDEADAATASMAENRRTSRAPPPHPSRRSGQRYRSRVRAGRFTCRAASHAPALRAPAS